MTAVTSETGQNSYQYDANGNMTQRIENGVTWTQIYNAENRLQSLNNGTTTWLFSYDGDGNRVSHLMTDGVTATATYYFMGGGYEMTSDGTNTTVRKYYAIAGQTYAMNDNGTMKYFLTDHLGSVVGITGADGTLLEQSRYLPYGQARGDVGSISSTDKMFTGQKDLANTGLLDYNARMYSSELGRFIQPDSIVPGAGNPQAWNRFSYTLNNPVNYVDPSGHDVDCGIGNQYCDSLKHELGVNWREGLNRPSPKTNNSKSETKDKPYFLSDTSIEITDAYMLGWENFGTAWEIYWNTDATIGQRAQAEAYMAAWGGTHFALAVGIGLVAYGVWQLAVVGAGACGLNPQCSTNSAQTIAKYTETIYRNASGTGDSLTPRMGIDTTIPQGGLSFWNSIDKLNPGKYVAIDPTKLNSLTAILDNNPIGHVTVMPNTISELESWAMSRGTGIVHPFTQELLNAIVEIGKR